MIREVCALVPALHELNKGKGLYSDQYPVLKTKKKSSEEWWDSLKGKAFRVCGKLAYHSKMDVGTVAMHFHKMSANYKWDCYSTKYADLTKSQRAIVDFVFEQRSKNYSMFHLPAMLS